MSVGVFLESLKSGASGDALTALAGAVIDVEHELRSQVRSTVPTVDGIGALTLGSGGKRLRPALTILAAKATGRSYEHERAVRLAAALELIHMASLVHDDVVDEAETRRGSKTAAKGFGQTAAILGGDVMLAKAMRILAEDGDLDVIRSVSSMVVEVVEGEVAELELRDRFDLDLDTHLQVLDMKTAAFVAECCRVGAMVAGSPKEEVDALAEYGQRMGRAFQIVDDLLDYEGDPEHTGKPLATDFREGCATLPLLLLQSELTDDETSFVRRKFGNGVAEDELRLIVSWMRARGSMNAARRMAEEEIRLALEALHALPASDEREVLSAVARFVVDRRA